MSASSPRPEPPQRPADAHPSVAGRVWTVRDQDGTAWRWDGRDWQLIAGPSGPTAIVGTGTRLTWDAARRVWLADDGRRPNDPTGELAH